MQSRFPKLSILDLSAEDKALLEKQFYISDPRQVPGLRERAPETVAVSDVELVYALDLPESQRRLWPRCCVCQERRHHRSGYVALFEDDVRGLIGQNCGQMRHRLDFKARVVSFDADNRRANLLRLVMSYERGAQLLRGYGLAVRTSATLAAMNELSRTLKVGLPGFFNRLSKSSGGAIEAVVRVRDIDAQRRRDASLDRKLNAMAERRRVTRGSAGVDGALLEELRAARDPDADKTSIMVERTEVVHRFRGGAFFSDLSHFAIRMQRLEQRANDVFLPVRGKPSDSLTTKALQDVCAAFATVLRDAEALHDLLEQAHGFADPGNIAGLVDLWNQLNKSRSDKQLLFQNGLIGPKGATAGPTVHIALSPFAVSKLPLEQAQRVSFDAEDWEDGNRDTSLLEGVQ